MKLMSLAVSICLLMTTCNHATKNDLANGVWKIRKVEIVKDHEIQKVIDTGYQYWSFKKPSLIEIFDTHKMQNVLHIKIGNSDIRSYDVHGAVQDVFVIEEMDNEYLALSTKKKVEQNEYNVIYYLDKVKDTTAKAGIDGLCN